MDYLLTASELAQMNIYKSVITSEGLAKAIAHSITEQFDKTHDNEKLTANILGFKFGKQGIDLRQKSLVQLSKITGEDELALAERIVESLIASGVSESMLTIKRRHTDKHPAITARERAVIRNKIIKFIGDKKVTRDELMDFFNSMNEDEEVGRKPHASWLYKNKHLVKRLKIGKAIKYRLTRAGLNLHKKLEDDAS